MISGQNLKSPASNPRSFNTGVAQLRANLKDQSVPAEEIPGPAARVFDQLAHEVSTGSSREEISWELRMVRGLTGNAFSLPDGAVYVDNEMVLVLGNDPGLWAAVLAHEIVHVAQYHWTKRAAFQESLKDSRASWGLVRLGAFPPGLTLSTLADQQRELADFSQDLELEADVGSLGLMARSGFHPDFVTAVYHLMEAQEGNPGAAHLLASHPGWDVRESHVRKRYSAAVAEFARLWPDPSDSPGGGAPMLAFAGRPRAQFDARHTSAEITLPLRCENSTDSVEVLLLVRRLKASDLPAIQQTGKMRQTIACTGDGTLASFVLSATRPHDEADVDFYVMDSRGWVLARSSRFRVLY